jgi:GH43 family beta-xylosidase
VWAPEIHKINGKFYIHASGSVTGNSNPESMRMFVLEANSSDPFGSYTYKGLLSNNYAIDQSIWQDPATGNLYMSYSQWDNNIPNANPASLIQCTYICQMISPTQMGTGVRLSYPASTWEKHKWWVNEGQYFLKKGNKLHIVFSVSGCAAAEYSLAMLTCSNGDYLNPAAWTKSAGPVFTQDPSKSVYGTGHHSTVQTPNGEWWLVYHAVSDAAGACDGTRSTRMQPFTFDNNDNPVFGTPVATGVAMTCPGVSNVPNYWNFDTSLEGWNTPMNLTTGASGGFANLNITNSDPYIHSPNNLNISYSDFKYLVIRMQNQTASNTAELFWTTTTSTAYDGAKRVSIPIVASDTQQRTYIIDLSANANWNGTIKQIRLDPTTASSGTVKIDHIKFVGTQTAGPIAVPGTVQVEDFNIGGQGNAYNDADATNNGGQYRASEGVDIETTGDNSGAFNVGWTAADEWMEYLVEVAESGYYTIGVRAAAPGDGAQIQLQLDGENLGNVIELTNTGNFQVYTNNTFTAQLTSGQHILRVTSITGGYNINFISFQKNTPIVITPYTQINGGDWNQTNSAEVCVQSIVSFGPHPNVESGWSWTGPNGFTANTRQISFSAIETDKNGEYVATYSDPNAGPSTESFTIDVLELPAATVTTTETLQDLEIGSITFEFGDNPTRTNIAFSINDEANYTSVPDNSGSYTFGDLAAGNYPLWARWGNAECPVFIGNYEVTETITTTIASNESSDNVLIYPNPVHDNLTIVLPADYNRSTIELKNMLDQKVFTAMASGNSITIAVNHLPDGIYWLEVQNTAHKIIINR